MRAAGRLAGGPVRAQGHHDLAAPIADRADDSVVLVVGRCASGQYLIRHHLHLVSAYRDERGGVVRRNPGVVASEGARHWPVDRLRNRRIAVR